MTHYVKKCLVILLEDVVDDVGIKGGTGGRASTRGSGRGGRERVHQAQVEREAAAAILSQKKEQFKVIQIFYTMINHDTDKQD